MIHNHNRTKIISKLQHLLTHSLSDFAYGSSSLPGVTNAEEAIDWIVSVLYPNTKPAVATIGDLPTGLNTPNVGDVIPTINDYRIVNDAGAGKAAGYLFVKYDTDVNPVWHKVYDFDWGINQVLQGLVDATQPLYAKKLGSTDYDPSTSLAVTGTFAGQSIYGGEATNQNLTLNATNFDNTGFIQFNDNVRPTINSAFSLGQTLSRFLNIFTDSIVSGTTTISGGTITDTSGTVDFASDTMSTLGLVSSDTLSVGTSGTIGSVNISSSITTTGGTTSFSADNILTTGTINAGAATFTSGTIGDFSIGIGVLTSLTPTISIGSNNLLTTGNVTANDAQLTSSTIGLLSIATNIISSAGSVNINSTGLNVNSSLSVTGISLFSDNVSISALKTISFANSMEFNQDGLSKGGSDIIVNGNIKSGADAVNSIGTSAIRYTNLYMSGSIISGVNQMPLTELFRFNSTQFQDIAQTISVIDGDNLVYNAASGKWLPTSTTSSDHLTISNVNGGPNGDGGHSVFAKLGGRSGGQTINGGILSGQNIDIRNNTIDNIGITITSTEIKPTITSSVSLGSPVLRYSDIYMDGVNDGLRVVEKVGGVALDAYINQADVTKSGKIALVDNFLYANIAGQRRRLGQDALNTTINLTAVTSVTISTGNYPALDMIWQIHDNVTGEVINTKIVIGPSSVTVSRDALIVPANSWKIKGITAQNIL